MVKNSEKKVLVTGITGFIGLHVALELLKNGYCVRGSMRDLGRKDSILKILEDNCKNIIHLEFVKGELTVPEDWDKALEGMDYVMHVASPLPFDLKKDENDLIIPAREGTLNVLKAAHKHHVKRVVLTSSLAAIGHGHKGTNGKYTEDDWTNLSYKKGLTAYYKSKTIAEREAWKFVNQQEVKTELAVINPGYVLGPLLEKDYSDSAVIVKKLMTGDMPGLPRVSFPIVDVRDVAEMHVWALEKKEAASQRFICVNDAYWYREIAETLLEKYPEYKSARSLLDELGKYRVYENKKAIEMFNWKPRSNKEAILSMAETLIKFGLVKP